MIDINESRRSDSPDIDLKLNEYSEKRMGRPPKGTIVKRQNETEEQRQKRLEKLRENQRNRLAKESEEKRAERLSKLRQYQQNRLKNETQEQREKRLEKLRQNQRMRLQTETMEERRARLKKQRDYQQFRLEQAEQVNNFLQIEMDNKVETKQQFKDIITNQEPEITNLNDNKRRRRPNLPKLVGDIVTRPRGRPKKTETTQQQSLENPSLSTINHAFFALSYFDEQTPFGSGFEELRRALQYSERILRGEIPSSYYPNYQLIS